MKVLAINGSSRKMVKADGIILGSPVYSADVSSNIKEFIWNHIIKILNG